MRRKVSIEWYYQRAGCTACAKAREFLGAFEVDIREQIDARRTRIGPSDVGKVVPMRAKRSS